MISYQRMVEDGTSSKQLDSSSTWRPQNTGTANSIYAKSLASPKWVCKVAEAGISEFM